MGDSHETSNPPDNVDGDKWEKYFTNLYKEHASTEVFPEPPGLDHDYCKNPINKPFTKKELDTVITMLKRNKAAGMDKVLAEFLKASPEPMRKLLLRLFNTIFKAALVPKSWCLGIINPIHKEGPKDDPDNYRGICIGSILMKTMSMLMNNRLMKYALDNNLVDKAQIGFMANNRAPDHILTLKSLVNKYVTDKKGGKLYTCFIDFRKAFDTVWHEGIFQKLTQVNINGNFLDT